MLKQEGEINVRLVLRVWGEHQNLKCYFEKEEGFGYLHLDWEY